VSRDLQVVYKTSSKLCSRCWPFAELQQAFSNSTEMTMTITLLITITA